MVGGDSVAEFGAQLLERFVAHHVVGPVLGLLLDEIHRRGALGEAARALVPRAFDSCPRPSEVLEVEAWVSLFRASGFSRDWRPAPRPDGARRLFRGATPAGVAGMCWSTDVAVARWYAAKRPGGMVVSAEVEPERQLAELGLDWERLVVVDPIGLDVEVIEPRVELLVAEREALARRLGVWT
ncbi:hypothetical protein [Aeromicrobium sp. CnD17-E]|uniref:hypothetical protein n=1 Tax=Aeromicrobium sp. CnD17-E TaxID=2954487 RepID=UPI00209800D1|nr:hypothetical protein [Aeromicrobium sp. CnD17-E]